MDKLPKLGLGTFLMVEDAYEVVSHALKIGYRHIDTAQAYHNEAEIGRALKDSGLKREEYFITTKLSARKLTYEDAIKELESSLEKLGLDYVDLYLIHWPSQDYQINLNTWRGLEKVYQEGKAKRIGVSNFQKHHLNALLEDAKIKPMYNQVELHPGLQQTALKHYLDDLGIHTISFGPFMRGEVFQKEGRYYETLKRIADKHHATVAQIVIAWGLARGIHMIPKTATKERLQENFDAQQIKLDKDDLEAILKLNRGRRIYTDPDNYSFYE
ncbi:MAG: aldo/keto reductase [Acholeplasmataceae bacterium]